MAFEKGTQLPSTRIAQENDKSSKNPTMTVFADLSKAFDTISHDILLRKLDNLGIRGIANSWFHSYLSNRTQYMEIFHHKSKYETIKCGVPQGSILGPILFLIYINDITNQHLLMYCALQMTLPLVILALILYNCIIQ